MLYTFCIYILFNNGIQTYNFKLSKIKIIAFKEDNKKYPELFQRTSIETVLVCPGCSTSFDYHADTEGKSKKSSSNMWENSKNFYK